MSNSPSEEGGLPLATSNVNTQDLSENSTKTAVQENIPADQVGGFV